MDIASDSDSEDRGFESLRADHDILKRGDDMSVSSVILALLASGFAVNSAGNLKEAWNKSSDSFKNSSFFSPKAKWGFNFAEKLGKTVSFPLLAVDNLTGGKIQFIALRSALEYSGGKLPNTGRELARSIANLKKEAGSNFGLSTSAATETRIDKKEAQKTNEPQNISEEQVDTTPRLSEPTDRTFDQPLKI